jgi:iron-sulfur cluster assembly protein
MSVTFSIDALEKVKTLLGREQNPGTALLRVFVAPGGCHGLSYGMNFEKLAKEGDVHQDIDGVPIVLDSLSNYMMRACTVEYHDTLMQSGFEITNSEAKTTCACGTSFASDELPGEPEAC